MTKKRVTVKQAAIQRDELITHYDGIAYNQAPTKGIDSGAGGKLEELKASLPTSRKTRVSKQGKADNYTRWRNANGVLTIRPIEVKTNGGRIGALYNANPENLIVYKLNICNSNTSGIRRETPQKLFTIRQFLELADNCGAIKMATRDVEPQIQPTIKAWYEALLAWPIDYTPGNVYSEEDLRG